MEGKLARRNPRPQNSFASEFAGLAIHALRRHYFPRISRCVAKLGDEDLWWRPNPSSNSAGNLLLHLAGNVRQWITAGVGGAPDVRDRDREFSETGPIPGRLVAGLLRKEVGSACRVIASLEPRDFSARYAIQGFHVTGFQAIEHVVEHFAYHSGQIIYITKVRLGADLGFTRLPGRQKARTTGRTLPAI